MVWWFGGHDTTTGGGGVKTGKRKNKQTIYCCVKNKTKNKQTNEERNHDRHPTELNTYTRHAKQAIQRENRNPLKHEHQSPKQKKKEKTNTPAPRLACFAFNDVQHNTTTSQSQSHLVKKQIRNVLYIYLCMNVHR